MVYIHLIIISTYHQILNIGVSLSLSLLVSMYKNKAKNSGLHSPHHHQWIPPDLKQWCLSLSLSLSLLVSMYKNKAKNSGNVYIHLIIISGYHQILNSGLSLSLSLSLLVSMYKNKAKNNEQSTFTSSSSVDTTRS